MNEALDIVNLQIGAKVLDGLAESAGKDGEFI